MVQHRLIHPWKIEFGSSHFDHLLGWLMVVVAFSIPLEGVFPVYLGIRSSVFYLIGFTTILFSFRLVQLLKSYTNSFHLPLLSLVFIWSILIYFSNPVRVHREHIIILQSILMASLFLPFAHDVKWRLRFINFYAVGSVIMAILSVVEFYSTARIKIFSDGDVIRATVLVGLNTNQHAHLMGSSLILVILLLLSEKIVGFWLRTFLTLGSIIIFLTLLMTNSQSAIVGIVLLIALYLVQNPFRVRTKHIVFIFFLLIILMMVIGQLGVFDDVGILVSSVDKRLRGSIEEGNFSGRDELIFQLLNLGFETYFLGVGHGNAQSYLYLGTKNAAPHNHYLQVLVEAGLIPFTFLILSFYIMIMKGYSYYSKNKKIENGILFYPLIYLLIMSATIHGFYYKSLWFFIAMNSITPFSSDLKNKG